MKEVVLVVLCFYSIALSSGAINARTLAICLAITATVVGISKYCDIKHEENIAKRLKRKRYNKLLSNYTKKA